MFNKKTSDLLQTSLPSLPLIIGERSLRHDIDDLLSMALPKMRYAVVDDVNTAPVFGDKIAAAVKGSTHLTFADNIPADDDTVNYLRNQAYDCDALIAVGSGTLNDLCKYAAYRDNKPYIVFPTAASMNGYLSANASITVKGHKTTLPAKLPNAVFCDYSVIEKAPPHLTKSGLGDSLARPTAQADWLLSHLLLGTEYKEEPFELLKDIEPELFDSAHGIAKNDPATIQTLVKILLLSGLGMTIAGGSYPASQGEHMIAHSYGMLKKSEKLFKTFHGEEIAVTSLYMAKIQEKILSGNSSKGGDIFLRQPEIPAFAGMTIKALFGEELSEEFAVEYGKKQKLVLSLRAVNSWDDICEKIQAVHMPVKKLENIINKAELIATPEALGWSKSDYKTACIMARFTRNRFTFLDLAE